jgi:hypothetical protein
MYCNLRWKSREIWPALLPAVLLPHFPDCLQLPVALRVDLLAPLRQHVLWGDVARGAFQADVVVVVNVTLCQTPRIIERQRRSRKVNSPYVGLSESEQASRLACTYLSHKG